MEAKAGSVEGDELEILATLVDAYEAKRHAIDAPDPVAAIQFRMDQQGLTRRDLEQYIGSRARVSEIMTGRRTLTLPMVRRLRDHLAISADVLIASSPISRSVRRSSSSAGDTHGHRNTTAPMLSGEKSRKPRRASSGITQS